jgi:alpha-galactosidase
VGVNGNQVAWAAEIPGSKAKYVAVFNTGDAGNEQMRVSWSDLGLAAACVVRDLWAHKEIGTVQDGRPVGVKPHASGFYRITAAK